LGAQLSASPPKLPKQTTVKEPKWRRVNPFPCGNLAITGTGCRAGPDG